MSNTKRKTLYWTTKDGRKIAISKMSDSHLINTISFLEKKIIETRLKDFENSFSTTHNFETSLISANSKSNKKHLIVGLYDELKVRKLGVI